MATNIFRSEDMSFCELIVESEIAYKCMAALGELGRVQFLNLNEDALGYKLKFAANVRQCDEMERQIWKIEDALKKNDIRINTEYGDVGGVLHSKELKKLNQTLGEYETQLNEGMANIAALKDNRVDLVQFQGVIEMFERQFLSLPEADDMPLTAGPALVRQVSILAENRLPSEFASAQLGYITGVIDRSKAASFERVLWRVGRGNVFVRCHNLTAQIEDSKGQTVVSDVFVAFFHGDTLKKKVEQICQGYHAKIYPCPLKDDDRLRILEEIAVRRNDIEEILDQALHHRNLIMQRAAQLCKTWKIQVRKVKTVYHTMNMLSFDVTNKYLIGQCWVPTVFYDRVEMALRDAVGAIETGQYVFNKLPMPKTNIPTYFQTNKLSKSFQNIVHAFSIAKYKEINPALFTTITFPFLFAVMFGDFGHGVIMACFGAWMCIKEKSLKKYAANSESFGMIFGGRYTILLMGLFSMYAGVLYNDCFAKAFRIFQSSWHTNFTVEEIHRQEKFFMDPNNTQMEDPWPYPFGDDPAWDTSENRINFVNSMKMKLSIILGVAQMLFGICLSVFNHIYFKQWINIFFEFIPQILFITCLFVYMDALIIFKWIYFGADNVNSAPSVLITMINMCLFKYSEETPYDYFVYHNLMSLQYALFVIAILTIPWMLLVKPFYLRAQARQKQRGGERSGLLAAESTEQAADIELGQFGATQFNTIEGVVSLAPSSRRPTTVSMEQQDDTGSKNDGEDLNPVAQSRTATIASVVSQQRSQRSSVVDNSSELSEAEFDFSEVFIHQAIHTIEYVLGLISHTASYLRLWALSLAHSELSTVLWTMVFRRALSMASFDYTGCIAILIIFIPWACLTIAILVMMEGMSAFLHALRLHWVEFQSKFYEGGGTLFQPFNFKAAYAKK